MKRWVARIMVFLLLGAIINVAVAWGCVIRSCGLGSIAIDSSPEVVTSTWRRLALPGWVAEPVRGFEGLEFGVRSLGADAGQWMHTPPGGTPVTFARYLTFENSAGWPRLGLQSRGWLDNTSPGWIVHGSLDLPIHIGGLQGVQVPFEPLWPGFAINTVFYAAILWLLFAAPFAMRRRRRIKRGLCPKCAYDLRGSAPNSTACPECGRLVSGHSIVQTGFSRSA